MTNSKHYFNIKGKDAEEFAFNLAHKCFLEDWCYTNPEGSNQKEVCDLLVIFESVMIIFQIKSLKLSDDGKYKPSKVNKNVRQLFGAERRLLDETRPLTFQNPRRGPEVFDGSAIRDTYLISVIVGEGEDLSELTNKQGGKFVHMFSGEFLEIVLNELDTISDFCSYLSAKETCLGTSQMTIIGGEEELLASYLLYNRTFTNFEGHDRIIMENGNWSKLREKPEYLAKVEADEISYAWDGVIDRAHECRTPEYERIARELARPDRFFRRMLAEVFLEAWLKADKNNEHDIFRRVLDCNGVTFCFLYMNDSHPNHEIRRVMLGQLCLVARRRFPENHTVVGIGTEKKFGQTCSYDFGFVDIDDWTDDHEKESSELIEKFGLLANVTKSKITRDEYPG